MHDDDDNNNYAELDANQRSHLLKYYTLKENRIDHTSLQPLLELSLNDRVMITTNVDASIGLCSGAKGLLIFTYIK